MRIPMIRRTSLLLGLVVPACLLQAFSPIAPIRRSDRVAEVPDGILLEVGLAGLEPIPLAFEADCDFFVVYRFVIGADSHPTRISSVAGEGWIKDRRAALAGISKWMLFGLTPETGYELILGWEHGWGYQCLSLMGDQMNFSVTFPSGGFPGRERIRIGLPVDYRIIEPWALQANASFSIVSHFQTSEELHPTLSTLLAGKMFVDQEVLKACLARSILSGLQSGRPYVLVLYWRHATGFTRLSLLGGQMSLSLRLLN